MIKVIDKVNYLKYIRENVKKENLSKYIGELLDYLINPSHGIDEVKMFKGGDSMAVHCCSVRNGRGSVSTFEGIIKQFAMIAEITKFIDSLMSEAKQEFAKVTNS